MNQRLAPDLYVAVIYITGDNRFPELNGSGEVIDYALKMVQFDTNQELELAVATGAVDNSLVRELAEQLAEFHQNVARSTGQDFGLPEVVRQRIKANFIEIMPCMSADNDSVLNLLENWVDERLRTQSNAIADRKRDGFVRECHGDLHLGNMVLIKGRIRLFDCLEFNEQLRWIDVTSEIAFLVMDLDHQGRGDLAFYFLNQYLMVTGDYAGLELLPLYLVYRAMVRAKVACIKALQSTEQDVDALSLSAYLTLAQRYTQLPPPQLYIAHGLSGAGKSWLSERITVLLPAIHIRSDVERLRSSRRGAGDGSMAVSATRYNAENIERNYDELLRLTKIILKAGFSVIVDATFLRAARRERFRQLAVKMDTLFRILDFQCAEAVLRTRIRKRSMEGEDPSEATVEVLENQLRTAQPLSVQEKKYSIPIRTDEEVDVPALTERILRSAA